MLPLDGIKVVDLSHAAAGPCCTMLLAGMGADVIKIEPVDGESFRNLFNGSFLMNLGRNKRDMALNLKDKEGQEIVLKLVEKADVLMENFTPGTTEKLGLGYNIVNQINPGIVYCSISGYGQSGPYRERPALDPVAQAISGVMMLTGEADRLPARIGPSTIDYGTGMMGAYAIALALMNREKSGKGQRIDLALFDTAIFYMSHFITNYSLTGQLPVRMGSGMSAFAPYQVFEAKDKLVFIGVTSEKTWKGFCQVLSLDSLVEDPLYITNNDRCQNREELVSILTPLIKRYGSEDLITKLLAVDIPCAPLLDVAEVIEDSHVVERGTIMDVDYQGKGKSKVVHMPVSFSEMMPLSSRAPMLGEHTTEVLEELGYNKAEISRFVEKGVVKQHVL